MKTAAFVNLPVNAGRRFIVTLNAIHSEIVFFRCRAFRINERQCDEMPAVFVPKLKQRQFFEIRRFVHYFRYRRTLYFFRSELQSRKRHIAKLPKLFRFRRQKHFDHLDGAAHEFLRLFGKTDFNALDRSEKIRHDRIFRALHVFE